MRRYALPQFYERVWITTVPWEGMHYYSSMRGYALLQFYERVCITTVLWEGMHYYNSLLLVELYRCILTLILLHAFCLHFLRIHHDYFFMITISLRKYKQNLQRSSLTFVNVKYGIWRPLDHSFCEINWNSSFLVI